MILAIFQEERVYEGNTALLNAVYPMPVLSRVCLRNGDGPDLLNFGPVNSFNPPIFREDSFDPTTRIRRGRFYVPNNPSRLDWSTSRVNHHPYAPPVAGFPIIFSMDAYTSFQMVAPLRGRRSLVFLGSADHETAWRVIGTERLFNGETSVTLRAANTLGTLPELTDTKVDTLGLASIADAVDKVADASNMYLPVPTVDVCREAARQILARWLPLVDVADAKGDLSDLIKSIPSSNACMASAAQVISRLHPRGKSSEQERQSAKGNELRAITSDDAEIAVGLIGFMLRETGWTT